MLQVMPAMIEHCMPGLKGNPSGIGIPLALYRYPSSVAVPQVASCAS